MHMWNLISEISDTIGACTQSQDLDSGALY